MTTILRISSAPASGNWFQRVTRYALVAMGALIGAVLFLVTASAALMIFLVIAALAALAFAIFWIRAKIKGQTVREAAMKDAAKQMGLDIEMTQSQSTAAQAEDDDGPVIDAHRTVDGWSVDQ